MVGTSRAKLHARSPLCLRSPNDYVLDAAFLLTVGSFLLTVELFYLRMTMLAFYLQLELFRLQF